MIANGEEKGKQEFIQSALLNILRDSQKTKNIQGLRILSNYFGRLCRAKDAFTPKILETFKEVFQRTLLDGDFEGMNIMLSNIRLLPPEQIKEILEPGAIIKNSIKKWITITVPTLKDPDYVQQGKLKIYQQLSKDKDFALDPTGADFKIWRELLQQAIEFNNPEFVRQILMQVKLMTDPVYKRNILGLKTGHMTIDSPLTWSTNTVLDNPKPEIIAKQREIVNLLSTAPEMFPVSNDISAWNAMLQTACSTDILLSDTPRIVFLKFAEMSDQKKKAEILMFRSSTGIGSSVPLMHSAIETKNYSMFPLLCKLGADPNVQNQTGDSIFHVLLRDYKNLERMKEWLPIVQDPALNINLVNSIGETALMQFLFMAEDISNLTEVTKQTKKQILSRWMDCVMAIVNRPELDVTLKNKQGMSLPEIVADLQVDKDLKSQVAQIIQDRMNAGSRPSDKSRKFI